MKRVLIKSALMAVFAATSGCTTTQYVEVRPECEPVVTPALPDIDRGSLWESLGDSEYRTLERYIDGIWSVIDEQRAVINNVCAEKSPQDAGNRESP